MKLFSLLMLKNFHSHLSWKLSWTPSHKIMVSIISMNMNKTELPATKWFTIVHCRPWNMVHGSNLNWNRCITRSIGVEPGILILSPVVTARMRLQRSEKCHKKDWEMWKKEESVLEKQGYCGDFWPSDWGPFTKLVFFK